MLELADIFRAVGPHYREGHAGQMLPSHQRAMRDIIACRTPALGGSLYQCDKCGALDYSYHSCRDRHCPKCVARAHQALVYAALLREAAASVQTLADDRQWVGGTLGILAVLHTWSRTLEYHPHAHLLVTAG